MKNFKSICSKFYSLLLLLIFIFSSLFSQAQNDPVRQELDHFFAPVSKPQIFTQLLKEYGYQFVTVANYNGVLADSNIVDANALRMLYASLLSGNVANSVEAKPVKQTGPTNDIILQLITRSCPVLTS